MTERRIYQIYVRTPIRYALKGLAYTTFDKISILRSEIMKFFKLERPADVRIIPLSLGQLLLMEPNHLPQAYVVLPGKGGFVDWLVIVVFRCRIGVPGVESQTTGIVGAIRTTVDREHEVKRIVSKHYKGKPYVVEVTLEEPEPGDWVYYLFPNEDVIRKRL
jgi:hypothetical protein